MKRATARRKARSPKRLSSISSPIPRGAITISDDQLVQNALDGLIRHGRKTRFAKQCKQFAILLAVVVGFSIACAVGIKHMDKLPLQRYINQVELSFGNPTIAKENMSAPALSPVQQD